MSFLNGLPHETVEDLRFTIDVIEKVAELNPNLRVLNPFYQPVPGAPTYDEMVRLGWRPPRTLEGWAEVIDYDLTIEDVEPFPWMTPSEFDLYVKVFSDSVLNERRLGGVLGKQ